MREEELRAEQGSLTDKQQRPYTGSTRYKVISLMRECCRKEKDMLFSYPMKDNKLFNRAFRNGRFCACHMVTAYYLPNDLAGNRVGISVSKKIGGAVERNRAKRIIRAAYRLHETEFPTGMDIVFAVRPGIDGKKTQDIEAFFADRLLADMNSAFDENGGFIRKPKKK